MVFYCPFDRRHLVAEQLIKIGLQRHGVHVRPRRPHDLEGRWLSATTSSAGSRDCRRGGRRLQSEPALARSCASRRTARGGPRRRGGTLLLLRQRGQRRRRLAPRGRVRRSVRTRPRRAAGDGLRRRDGRGHGPGQRLRLRPGVRPLRSWLSAGPATSPRRCRPADSLANVLAGLRRRARARACAPWADRRVRWWRHGRALRRAPASRRAATPRASRSATRCGATCSRSVDDCVASWG